MMTLGKPAKRTRKKIKGLQKDHTNEIITNDIGWNDCDEIILLMHGTQESAKK